MRKTLWGMALILSLTTFAAPRAAAQHVPDTFFGCAVGRTTLPEARKMLAGSGITVERVETVNYGEPLVVCRAEGTAFAGYQWDALALQFRRGVLERVEFMTPGDMSAFRQVRANMERLYEGTMTAPAPRQSRLAMDDGDTQATLGTVMEGGTTFVYLSFGPAQAGTQRATPTADPATQESESDGPSVTTAAIGTDTGSSPADGQEEVIENSRAEVTARYPGGDAALLKFVADNLVYPTIAKETGVQGMVILRFKVDTEGSVSDVRVMKSLSKECDAAAVAVARKLKRFTPAKQQGQPVAVWYMLPVRFRLQ